LISALLRHADSYHDDTATGKLSKLILRQQLKDYRWPEAASPSARS
jgi:hypothetical protein